MNHFPASVTIHGIGLIGGGLALAFKKASPGIRIVGVDHPEVLARARNAGIVEPVEDEHSELTVLATPVRGILKLIEDVAPHSLIMDVGSTKLKICEAAAERQLPFIGGHPMVGSERSGFETADADMFRGARFFLCPVPSTPSGCLERMEGLVRSIGALPTVIDAAGHDRVVARVSHLPQLLSTVLSDYVGEDERFGGAGLQSMGRLAGSSFEIWHDIFETSGFLAHEITLFIERLSSASRSIEGQDWNEIRGVFDRAKRRYRSGTH